MRMIDICLFIFLTLIILDLLTLPTFIIKGGTPLLNYIAFVALGFTILGLFVTIITNKKTKKNLDEITKQNKRLEERVKKLRTLSESIADHTRKPLEGIEDIFLHCSRLIEKKNIANTKFWFVGLTLGFGPPHKYRSRINEILKQKSHNYKSIKEMITDFHANLGAIASGINPTIVCMGSEGTGHTKDIVLKKFVKQLTKRELYQTLIGNEEKVAEKVVQLHTKVEKKVDSDRPIKYLESLPMQIMVVEVKTDVSVKKACVVFHVGTENIDSRYLDQGEMGFYSELDSICDMFAKVAESLYNQ